MRWAIDLILLAVLALCVWNGYKKGLIMGVGGVACILVSLYGACLLSSTFSYEVVSAVRPFAGGYIDRVIANDVSEEMGFIYDDEVPPEERYSINDIVDQDNDAAREFAVTTFRCMGIYDTAAEQMGEESLSWSSENKVTLKEAVAEVFCNRLVYVAGVILCFFIILILLVFIGNIPNLVFRLPNMEEVDEIGGAIVGLCRGVLFCMLIAWALKFMGILIGPDTLGESLLGRLFVKIGFIARFIGI